MRDISLGKRHLRPHRIAAINLHTRLGGPDIQLASGPGIGEADGGAQGPGRAIDHEIMIDALFYGELRIGRGKAWA